MGLFVLGRMRLLAFVALVCDSNGNRGRSSVLLFTETQFDEIRRVGDWLRI